jgi:fucose permease
VVPSVALRSSLAERRVRVPVLLSYVAFILVGVTSGVEGVLLLAQMHGYDVGQAAIGLLFFTSSAGFAASSLSTGPLIHRFGVRGTLAAGGVIYVLTGLYLATRPPFAAFILVQLGTGFALGILESALSAYLAGLPDATTVLNRLHAFFGVGALIGPALAAWLVGFGSWTLVWLVLALACIPLTVAFALAYPGPVPVRPPASDRDAAGQAPAPAGGLLGTALRQPAILLGAAMLAVYVGLELTAGIWGFSYMVQARELSRPVASYTISGFWLGLTLGRFLISPIATRVGATPAKMMYACLTGITIATLAWLSPAAVPATVALVLLGFFLGPVFPTTMSLAPRLTEARLVPTAIGVMNAASTIGGAVLPWLAGLIAQHSGIWTLVPFALSLALLQFVVWYPIARRLPVAPVPEDAAS